jgi:hypothetical protein
VGRSEVGGGDVPDHVVVVGRVRVGRKRVDDVADDLGGECRSETGHLVLDSRELALETVRTIACCISIPHSLHSSLNQIADLLSTSVDKPDMIFHIQVITPMTNFSQPHQLFNRLDRLFERIMDLERRHAESGFPCQDSCARQGDRGRYRGIGSESKCPARLFGSVGADLDVLLGRWGMGDDLLG